MSMIPKEVVRELIRTEKPQSTQEVLDLLKEMFKDVLQGALEAELDEHLGYEKHDKSGIAPKILLYFFASFRLPPRKKAAFFSKDGLLRKVIGLFYFFRLAKPCICSFPIKSHSY